MQMNRALSRPSVVRNQITFINLTVIAPKKFSERMRNYCYIFSGGGGPLAQGKWTIIVIVFVINLSFTYDNVINGHTTKKRFSLSLCSSIHRRNVFVKKICLNRIACELTASLLHRDADWYFPMCKGSLN